MSNTYLTDIDRIGLVKRTGNETARFYKKIVLASKTDFAAIKLDALGVCGVFVNGQFVDSHTGRYSHRILFNEITSLLKEGENEIMLELGGHYYQRVGEEMFNRRKSMISSVAAEIIIETQQGTTRVVTNEDWSCMSDDGQTKPEYFSSVTKAEYERYWLAANLWQEEKQVEAPVAIKKFAGEEYVNYIANSFDKYATPKKLLETNMEEQDGELTSKVRQFNDIGRQTSVKPYAVYDFGRLHVGFVEFEYFAEEDGSVRMMFDYSESTDDFEQGNIIQWHIDNLAIETPVKKGKNTILITRRRAFRFIHIQFSNEDSLVKILDLRVRIRMKAPTQLGWFNSSEAQLNKMWEVGKYTLHINKHQEYESCPRNEMKFFSGDGVIDAKTDYYTFGDSTMVAPSLAMNEHDGNVGIRHNRNSRNDGLWDYPAWRIITVYNHYQYFNDIELIKKHYDELKECITWMIDRTNSKGLIYQFPIFGGHNYFAASAIDYSCSYDRLGEKPMLNALLYQSLKVMSEMGALVNDECAGEYLELSEKVKDAMDKYLWSEDAGAYLDEFDTSYIPGDGNALMLLFGIPDESKAKRIMRTLENSTWSPYGAAILSKEVNHTRGGIRTISPVMCAYEAEGRFLYGDADSAVELIRRCWGTMLNKGAETFWEFTANDETTRWIVPAHAWSSGCTYLLSGYVGGIRPATVGYETTLFAPYDKLDYFTCVVPTAKGLMASKCQTVDDKKRYELCVPKGTKLELRLPEGATLTVIEY